MKAAVFEKFRGPLSLKDVADPECPSDGVIVDVGACGVCRSDWHGWMGHDSDVSLPHVPGHELAGTVSEVGPDVRKWKVGDRMTVPFCCGCGECEECHRQCEHICDHYFQPGVTYWGGFAEQVAIPKADVNLITLPDEISFVAAASLGCRFATSFRAVMQQGQVRAGQTIAVFGCGGVGLSAVMIAHAVGAKVIAVDINERRLNAARALGASTVINSSNAQNVGEEIRTLTDGGVDVAFDAIGHAEVVRESVLSLRKQGKHVQVGLLLGEHADPAVPMGAVIARELEIYGSHGMAPNAYPAMLEMIIDGRLYPEKLVSETITLSEACRYLPGMDDFPGEGAVVIDRFDC